MATKTDGETLDSMGDRIGRALGEAMGGRFNVLASFSKEADTPKRTITIVDRWAEPSFTLTLEVAA